MKGMSNLPAKLWLLRNACTTGGTLVPQIGKPKYTVSYPVECETPLYLAADMACRLAGETLAGGGGGGAVDVVAVVVHAQ